MSLLNNDFEGKLREALEHYELPYEHSRWLSFERKLNKGIIRDISSLIAAAAAVVVTIAGSYFIYTHYIREVKALQSHAVARYADFKPVTEVKAVEHSINGNRSELTHADLLLFSAVDSQVITDRSEPSRRKLYPGNDGRDQSTGADTPVTARAQQELSAGPVSPIKPAESRILGVNVSMSKACAGSEVEFSVKNGPDKGSYLWNFGDGNFSNKPEPKHRYDRPGVFDVSLSVTDQNGRITTNVMSGLVTISPSPQADFTWDFVESPSEAPSVKIVNTSENASRFGWSFDNGQTSTAMNPVLHLQPKGRQMVVLEVSNEWGCSDSKVKYISVNHDYNIQAAEKLRLGKDVFMPEALRSGRMNFKLKIFSGDQVVFETSNRNKGWNGHLPGGEIAFDGQSFSWIVIIFNESTREEKFFSGVVTTVNP